MTGYIFKTTRPFIVVFLVVELLVRLALLTTVVSTIEISIVTWAKLFAVGACFDLVVLGYFLLPYVAFLILTPGRYKGGVIERWATSAWFACSIFVVLYTGLSEWIFWDEFTTRFNFIAVDYLVYTHEVLANIWESYPVLQITGVIILATVVITIGCVPYSLRAESRIYTWKNRLITMIFALVVMPVALFHAMDISNTEISEDREVNELAKNGLFSFFSAFRNNELPYDEYYALRVGDRVPPSIQKVVHSHSPENIFVNPNSQDIARVISTRKGRIKKNVVVIVLESMSAEFMQRFGWSGSSITPTLDRLANESLFFEAAFATGTRTVRGLEAISLSTPPTPGRSIVKRPNNENLSSIGFIFQERDYATKFFYGGNGYFDNMSYFFSHNGFDIIDRDNFTDAEISFANAWGLCDGDIYRKVLRESDRTHRDGHHFMHIVMTTSNHRPYTFPSGIDGIPASKGGRQAGVKYADYALGEYLDTAKHKPWFDNTVFVIVADHTANAAGKQELSPEKYHIPMLIYAPGFIKPLKYGNVVSQIDLAPTLLGQLNFSYVSRFYGEDVLNRYKQDSHAFVANYQKLGYLSQEGLFVLRPNRSMAKYQNGTRIAIGEGDYPALSRTISYYRHASNWQEHLKRIATIPNESISNPKSISSLSMP